MKKWEYQITRYHLENFVPEEKVSAGTFYCDQKGQCFLHDTLHASTDMLLDALNEEGKRGWELVQFGYHRNDLLCIWKRAID